MIRRPPSSTLTDTLFPYPTLCLSNDAARSDPAWFETGLLAPEDWRGDGIEAEDTLAAADRAAGVRWMWSDTALDPRPHAFRLDFDAPDDLVRAALLVSGKEIGRAHV